MQLNITLTSSEPTNKTIPIQSVGNEDYRGAVNRMIIVLHVIRLDQNRVYTIQLKII